MSFVSNLNKKLPNPKKFSTTQKVGLVLLLLSFVGYAGLFLPFITFLHSFTMGFFGLFAYILFFMMSLIGGAMLKGSKYVYPKRYAVYLILALISTLSIFHILFSATVDMSSYSRYLLAIYNSKVSIGGLLLGLIIYPIEKLLNLWGACVLYAVILAFAIWKIADFITNKNGKIAFNPNSNKRNLKRDKVVPLQIQLTEKELKKQAEQNFQVGIQTEQQKELSDKELAMQKLGLLDKRNSHFTQKEEPSGYNNFNTSIFKSAEPQDSKPEQPSKLTPPTDFSNTFGYGVLPQQARKKPNNYNKNLEFLDVTLNSAYAEQNKKMQNNSAIDDYNVAFERPVSPKAPNIVGEPLNNSNPIESRESFLDVNFGGYESKKATPVSSDKPLKDLTIEDLENIDISSIKLSPTVSFNKPISSINDGKSSLNELDTNRLAQNNVNSIEEIPLKPQQEKFDEINDLPLKQKIKKHKPYVYPTIDLLTTESTNLDDYAGNIEANSRAIEQTLESFHVPAKVIAVTKGPAVTRYELEMPQGISVNKITQLSNDIAMAVASANDIRIEAPIPGKSAVGIEVPNLKVATVSLKEVIESKDFQTNHGSTVFAVGKEISGNMRVASFNSLCHLLIAGSTGSGKSVCINAMIISLLYKYTPDELKFIMIDPKLVEFSIYNGIPHMLIPNAVTEPEKMINALDWAINEMQRRYMLFKDSAVRDINEYLKTPEVVSGKVQKLPYIILIIDEVGDIMSLTNFKKDFEEKVVRIAQKARACGIYLVLATQRPSVNVITGVIKNNLPSRIAFAVTSFQDSRTILDMAGAENLLGRGDMLYAPRDLPSPKRIQGCYVSDKEVKAVTDFIRQNNECYFDPEIEETINREKESSLGNGMYNTEMEFDPLMKDALRLVMSTGTASTTAIQRRFSIGFSRAGRIMDQMTQAQYVSPPDGTNKPRTVFITEEMFREKFGEY